jgi:hypothetical protein
VAGGRVGGEGGRGDPVGAIFRLHAVEGADVAGEHGLVDAGLIIAEQGVELRPLELQIELADRSRIVAPLAAIGVDGVISLGIDHAAEAALVASFLSLS